MIVSIFNSIKGFFSKPIIDLEEDFVEVDPPKCQHKGEKYTLMFGEVICRGCMQWTGEIESYDDA